MDVLGATLGASPLASGGAEGILWKSFSYPEYGGINVKPFIGPLWKIYLTTESGDPVYAAYDSFGYVRHAYPIQLDRYGNYPEIYIDPDETYQVQITNEYGVTKFHETYTWSEPGTSITTGRALADGPLSTLGG